MFLIKALIVFLIVWGLVHLIRTSLKKKEQQIRDELSTELTSLYNKLVEERNQIKMLKEDLESSPDITERAKLITFYSNHLKTISNTIESLVSIAAKYNLSLTQK